MAVIAFSCCAMSCVSSLVQQVFTLSVPPLQSIDLSGCQLLTDNGIQALTSSCKNLETVNISSCYELSDRAFECLGSCRSLQTIDACGCERLTDMGLQALAEDARYALAQPGALAPLFQPAALVLAIRDIAARQPCLFRP